MLFNDRTGVCGPPLQRRERTHACHGRVSGTKCQSACVCCANSLQLLMQSKRLVHACSADAGKMPRGQHCGPGGELQPPAPGALTADSLPPPYHCLQVWFGSFISAIYTIAAGVADSSHGTGWRCPLVGADDAVHATAVVCCC